jgi:hypothetical protein
MKRLFYIALLLASSSALFAADPPSASGLWKIDGDVMGTPVRMTCTLTETANRLAGSCAGAADGYTPHLVDGRVKAQKVEFHFQSSFGGGGITLIVSGTLNDDRSKMDGSLDVEPMAVGGTFSGARVVDNAEAPTTPPANSTPQMEAASPTPLSAAGTWKVEGDVQGNPVKMTCVLAEADHKLTGTCTGAGDDPTARPLLGQVTDKGLAWRFDSQYQGTPITLTMTGELATGGTKMNGSIAVSPFDAYGTFAAVKQQQ